MSVLDWIVLAGTLIFIVAYGVWKTRGSENIEGFLLGDKSMKWWSIGLSIMATQASAITFLSTPGQAYEDGMRFIQFYFGLPVAMVIISITAVPLYAKLKVYTAYEYLESRFDLKTRTLAAFLFLIQRGLAAGITIYAPSIILSTLFGWNLTLTNILMGGLVIVYTVSGGTRAVSVTQNYQMAVMMGGMAIAGGMIIYLLPHHISFGEAVQVAGKMGKLNIVDFSFDVKDRYNFWSGITGGLFLAMAYFGTDQSQVARYLSGKSIAESRLGLLFNGLLKIPMQFLILFIGAMVFVFYQMHQPPVFFNKAETEKLQHSSYASDFKKLEDEHKLIFLEKKKHVNKLIDAIKTDDHLLMEQAKVNIKANELKSAKVKKEVVKLIKRSNPDVDVKDTNYVFIPFVTDLIKKSNPDTEVKDTDYVFITFVMDHLPHGLIGLLLAVIFCAAMSSTSSELNALASTTCVDLYKRSMKQQGTDQHYLNASRWFTVLWGAIAIFFAVVASMLENLIVAVNILGSLFYGTILGIFLAAFYFRYITSHAIFFAALIAEAVVLVCYATLKIGFLWYNVIGCMLVILLASLLQIFIKDPEKERT
jgi:solute:Na+ symporter, SSS family